MKRQNVKQQQAYTSLYKIGNQAYGYKQSAIAEVSQVRKKRIGPRCISGINPLHQLLLRKLHLQPAYGYEQERIRPEKKWILAYQQQNAHQCCGVAFSTVMPTP